MPAGDVTAQARESAAFRELTEPYHRELQVHCYRMLGSFQDAEDALQETLLAAWQGFAGFQGRASLRTWLYRIATNRCLNARRTASRRPAKAWDIPQVTRPSRPGWARSSGWSPFRTLCWKMRRLVLKRATS
ncbi:sigma-70 family RNA polymerase sigma factor [Fodinicola feengrottensis]|uniref:sigma-70 family RNA polymerase sigma factor n=1 Tax=Fodinicola feengrottensis TaxID=435914 RepID=UPI002442C633|nr:sigma-70 family RNA polymerase sigma factor [Fodinicola feengrottensis]